MYNYDNPRYRAKVWDNIKWGAVLAVVLWVLALATGKAQSKTYTVADRPMPLDSVTGLVSYVGVIAVSGVTSDQLFTRAKSFLFKSFKSASAVVQVEDKTGGLLGVHGIISIVENPNAIISRAMDLKCPIELRFKDGRFRYEMTGLMLALGPPVGEMPFDNNKTFTFSSPNKAKRISEKDYKFLLKVDATLRGFIDALATALKQPAGKEDF